MNDALMDDALRDLVESAYAEILRTASQILRNCKLFSIEILQQENPSYEEMAEQLEEVAKIIEAIQSSYPKDADGFRTAVKAKEYTQNIANIARAIRFGDRGLLQEYINELGRRPFL